MKTNFFGDKVFSSVVNDYLIQSIKHKQATTFDILKADDQFVVVANGRCVIEYSPPLLITTKRKLYKKDGNFTLSDICNLIKKEFFVISKKKKWIDNNTLSWDPTEIDISRILVIKETNIVCISFESTTIQQQQQSLQQQQLKSLQQQQQQCDETQQMLLPTQVPKIVSDTIDGTEGIDNMINTDNNDVIVSTIASDINENEIDKEPLSTLDESDNLKADEVKTDVVKAVVKKVIKKVKTKKKTTRKPTTTTRGSRVDELLSKYV